MSANERYLNESQAGSTCKLRGYSSLARGLMKWGACALVVVLPGSFVVLAILWLYRRRAQLKTRLSIQFRDAAGFVRLNQLSLALVSPFALMSCSLNQVAEHGAGESIARSEFPLTHLQARLKSTAPTESQTACPANDPITTDGGASRVDSFESPAMNPTLAGLQP
jgi:hypothetical protein